MKNSITIEQILRDHGFKGTVFLSKAKLIRDRITEETGNTEFYRYMTENANGVIYAQYDAISDLAKAGVMTEAEAKALIHKIQDQLVQEFAGLVPPPDGKCYENAGFHNHWISQLRIINKAERNTRFSYKYCDAANYKDHYELVFKGELTEEERAYFEYLGEFIPHCLRLPGGVMEDDERYDPQYDHPWCLFDGDEAFEETSDEPNTVIDIHQFVKFFRMCEEHGWEALHGCGLTYENLEVST